MKSQQPPVKTGQFGCKQGRKTAKHGIAVKPARDQVNTRGDQHEYLRIQQAHMTAMSELVGAIAHQWRQPLNAFAIMIQNIHDAYEYDDLSSAFLEETVLHAMQQIHLMSKTIDDFRGFFRMDESYESFDVWKIVNDVVVLLSGLFVCHDIAVETRCELDTAEKPVLVVGGSNEFKQATFNVLMNAYDAILQRRKASNWQERGQITIMLVFSPDGRVTIRFMDNGGGIPVEVANRIFEPYFSTKNSCKGNGLGLYIAKMIIENNMGGSLSAQSLRDGALFTIELAAMH